MEPYIFVKSFVNDEFIKYYIEKSEKYNQHLSKVGKTVQINKKRRKDIFFNRTDCSLLDNIIFKEKNNFFKEHFECDLKYREKYKLGSYYSEDKGFYNPHTDKQGYHHRKISMVICFSKDTDYEGGIFKFVDLNKTFKFDKGDAIFFDSSLLHGVEPVTKGLRQVLISFLWDEDSEKLRQNKIAAKPKLNYLPLTNNNMTI